VVFDVFNKSYFVAPELFVLAFNSEGVVDLILHVFIDHMEFLIFLTLMAIVWAKLIFDAIKAEVSDSMLALSW
jgi:hypothetical protein